MAKELTAFAQLKIRLPGGRIDDLYTEKKRAYYSNRLVWDVCEEDPRAQMEPHVYEVSALAYKGVACGEGQDQSILVSGESGAG